MNETDYALFIIALKEKLHWYSLKELYLLQEAVGEVVDYKEERLNDKANDEI